MNKQREIFYKRRNRIIEDSEDKGKPKLKEKILELLKSEVDSLVEIRAPEGIQEKEVDNIIQEFITIIPFDPASQQNLKKDLSRVTQPEELKEKLIQIINVSYDQREKQIGPEIMRDVEKFTLLSVHDRLWMDHLDAITELRDGIGLRGDQRTALAEYQKEAYSMFERLVSQINFEIVRTVFRIQVRPHEQQSAMPRKSQAEKPVATLKEEVSKEAEAESRKLDKKSKPDKNLDAFASALSGLTQPGTRATITNRGPNSASPMRNDKKIGRNDPCPCGSGKKWKKCHYPIIPLPSIWII
jgi:preprotein translocase subunit SecA